MHFHFAFTAAEILWTLTFAAELVLLVVLLGRDRVRRFPWFTASIVMMALLLLSSKLLLNRMAPVTASAIFLALTDITALIGLLVVIELARRAFAGASRRAWLIGTLVLLAVAAAVLVLWGPWPAWSTLTVRSTLALLRGMQLFADKGSVLYTLLDIELAVAVVLFGRRFHGGWRSHPQQIVIGLSMAALSQLAVRIIWQLVATHTTIHSREQYERVMSLRDRMYHANNVVYLCVIVWWIAWLWVDEPGTGGTGTRESETDGTAAEGAKAAQPKKRLNRDNNRLRTV